MDGADWTVFQGSNSRGAVQTVIVSQFDHLNDDPAGFFPDNTTEIKQVGEFTMNFSTGDYSMPPRGTAKPTSPFGAHAANPYIGTGRKGAI